MTQMECQDSSKWKAVISAVRFSLREPEGGFMYVWMYLKY